MFPCSATLPLESGNIASAPELPRDRCAHPDILGSPPDDLCAHPDDLGAFPSDLGAHPDDLGAFPDDLCEHPDDLGAFPDDLGAFPENLCVTPWNASKPFSGSPDGDALRRNPGGMVISLRPSTSLRTGFIPNVGLRRTQA